MSPTSTPDLNNLETTAEPLETIEPDGTGDELTVVWGRFWGEDFPAGGMFAKYNHSNNQPEHIRVNLHSNQDPLPQYDPQQDPFNFLMALLDQESDVGRAVSRSDESLFTETLENYLAKPSLADQLFDSLEHENDQQFQNWGKQFFQEVFKSVDYTFQIRGQTLPEDYYEEQMDELDHEDETEQEQEKTTSEQPQAQTNGEEKNPDKVIPVKFQNNPVKGHYPEDLEPSTTLLARITGDVVSQLPEQFIDDERPDRSVPMRCTVESIDDSFDLQSLGLPRDVFDWDNTEDLQAVTVEIAEGIHGVGLVHENSRLKLPDVKNRTKNPEGTDYFHLLLLLLAASLLIFLYTMVG